MLFLAAAVVLCSNFPLLALSDNLELLGRSLRQLHRSGCQELSLSCPQGTSIALVSAKYSERPLCPGANADCQLPTSLQTAVERCQKKRHCKLLPSSSSYATDPCPGVRKHLSITYSCRPYEFRSKTACENEVVQLECGPNSRLAVYSASYGRTQYEILQCPQPQGVPEETCLASYTTKTVIDHCHGKRRCTLTVDSGTFGTPCKKDSRVYLKVVYTCVARQVLLKKYDQPPEKDEPSDIAEQWPDYDEGGEAAPNTSGLANGSFTQRQEDGGFLATDSPDEEDRSSELELLVNEFAGKVPRDLRLQILPSDEDVINCTVNIVTEGPKPAIGFVSEWITSYHFLTNNKERLVLYLAVSIGGGLLCLLALLAARLAWSSRKSSPSGPLPPFVGEFYDGETDLSIATAIPVDPSEVVRYPNSREHYYG